jgi:hypothetical protein
MFAGRAIGDPSPTATAAAVLRLGMILVAAGLGLGVAVDQPAPSRPGWCWRGGRVGVLPAGVLDRGPAAGCGARSRGGHGVAGRPPRVPGRALVIGALAEAIGLRWAFLFVAAVALALAVAASRIVPASARLGPAPVTDVRAW